MVSGMATNPGVAYGWPPRLHGMIHYVSSGPKHCGTMVSLAAELPAELTEKKKKKEKKAL